MASSSSQNLRPVTVRQLREATQIHSTAPYTIEGVVIETVSVVAMVAKIDTFHDKRRDWEVDDGTSGDIRLRLWTSHPYYKANADEIEKIQEFSYVCAFGQLEDYNNVRYMKVRSIRPIIDKHQIFCHLAEAMVATIYHESDREPLTVHDMRGLYSTKRNIISGPPQITAIKAGPSLLPQRNADQSDTVTTDTARLANPSEHSENESDSSEQAQDDSSAVDGDDDSDTEDSDTAQRPLPPKSPSPSPSPERQPYCLIGSDPLSYLSSLERAVLIAVHNNASLCPSGVPVALIAKGLNASHGPKPSELSDAVESLIWQGLIYTTEDDLHVLAVD